MQCESILQTCTWTATIREMMYGPDSSMMYDALDLDAPNDTTCTYCAYRCMKGMLRNDMDFG